MKDDLQNRFLQDIENGPSYIRSVTLLGHEEPSYIFSYLPYGQDFISPGDFPQGQMHVWVEDIFVGRLRVAASCQIPYNLVVRGDSFRLEAVSTVYRCFMISSIDLCIRYIQMEKT